MGNGHPADDGRAGTVSPTHPHNEQSLDGHKEMEQMCEDTPIKTGKIKEREEVVKVETQRVNVEGRDLERFDNKIK